MKKGTYDNPLKWLLAELPSYIEPAQLDVLMTRYNINKHAYDRQVKIRHVKRSISNYERFAETSATQGSLARWRARLEKLESEQGE